MTHADRQRLHGIMAVLIRHKAQLDYPKHDVRGKLDAETFALTWQEAKHRLEHGGRLMFDCSGSVTCVYKWTGGLEDPNGLGFKHEGYTGTMLAHLPHYSDAKRARTGALVVFGPGTGEHVGMVYTPSVSKGNPELFSHGIEHGVGPTPLLLERTYHHPPVTLLDVSGL